MDNLKQTETVKKALELEVHIANEESKLEALRAQQYPAAPKPPVCETAHKEYPKIIPQVEFNWVLAVVPSIFFLPWFPIYYFAIFRNNKKAEYERIKYSDEYKAQCAAVDAEFDRKQEALKKKYQELKNEYDNVTLPKYKKEQNEWTVQQHEKINSIKNEIKKSRDALSELYASSKIIPLQYRSINALRYIYDLMSTSDYDIKLAIDLYDRNEQRKLDSARLYEQQQANQLANEQNDLLYEQNNLLDEQNVISKKAKRDANIANVAGFIQHHNTNKSLKNISDNLFKKK